MHSRSRLGSLRLGLGVRVLDLAELGSNLGDESLVFEVVALLLRKLDNRGELVDIDTHVDGGALFLARDSSSDLELLGHELDLLALGVSNDCDEFQGLLRGQRRVVVGQSLGTDFLVDRSSSLQLEGLYSLHSLEAVLDQDVVKTFLLDNQISEAGADSGEGSIGRSAGLLLSGEFLLLLLLLELGIDGGLPLGEVLEDAFGSGSLAVVPRVRLDLGDRRTLRRVEGQHRVDQVDELRVEEGHASWLLPAVEVPELLVVVHADQVVVAVGSLGVVEWRVACVEDEEDDTRREQIHA